MATGESIRLRKGVTPPIGFAINTTVWQTSDNEVGQMPVQVKLDYANLYAAMGKLDEVLRHEQDAWDSIPDMKTTRH